MQLSLTSRTESPLDLSCHLPFKLAVVTNLLQLNKDASIRTITNLEPRELRVLLNIGSYMPIKSADIAYLGRLDTYTVSRAVKVLIRDKLITIEESKKNLKIKNLVLTSKGAEIYHLLCDSLNQRADILESALTENEKVELMRLLEILESQSEAMIANYAVGEQALGKNISADQKEIIRWYKKSRNASESLVSTVTSFLD